MKVLPEQLQKASEKVRNHKSFSTKFEAWKEWVLLFDKKEALEAATSRNAAKEWAL